MTYSVVDICIGGMNATSYVLSQIKGLMRDYPDNVISSENRGSDPECQLLGITAAAPRPSGVVYDELENAARFFPWAIVTVIFIVGVAIL
jgi:hypothetical protein